MKNIVLTRIDDRLIHGQVVRSIRRECYCHRRQNNIYEQ